jgi:hypothetical protein
LLCREAEVQPSATILLGKGEEQHVAPASGEVGALIHLVETLDPQPRRKVRGRILVQLDACLGANRGAATVGTHDQPAGNAVPTLKVRPADRGRCCFDGHVLGSEDDSCARVGGRRHERTRCGGVEEVHRTGRAGHLGRQVGGDGRLAPALIVVDETVGDVRARIEEDILESEALHLRNTPGPHQLPADTIPVVRLALEHQHAGAGPGHHGRERSSGDTATDHHVVEQIFHS